MFLLFDGWEFMLCMYRWAKVLLHVYNDQCGEESGGRIISLHIWQSLTLQKSEPCEKRSSRLN